MKKTNNVKSFRGFNENLNITDVMFSFSDMVGFSKWLMSVDDMDNQNRYFYIQDKDDFIDDDRNRYSWEDMYRIYQKN